MCIRDSICDVTLFYPKGECNVTFASLSAFSFCFHRLRDDLSMRIDNGSSAEKKKRELRKMQMFSNAFFCDRKHHHDLVLFQSVPSYLVRSTRHGLRRFFCSSWNHNESDSFLFLNERIKYSRNSRGLPT